MISLEKEVNEERMKRGEETEEDQANGVGPPEGTYHRRA